MDNHRAKRKPQGGAAGVIIVQVFEEKPTATSPRTSDAALLLPRPSGGLNPPLGYDRRQLLLAYSRQLRRLRAEQGSSAPPTWTKWKAALLHADRRIPTKRNIPPSWIHRLWGRIRRRRVEAAAPSPAAAKENGKWRRAAGMISRLWK